MKTLSSFIRFTKEELEDLLINLDQCESEGYLNSGDPAYTAMKKLEIALDEFNIEDDK